MGNAEEQTDGKRIDGGWIEDAIGRYESMLLNYSWRLTGSYEKAQDAVQDTFVKLCGADRSAVEKYLKAWLFKVCRNRSLELMRKERKMEALTEVHLDKTGSDGPSPYEQAERNESLDRISELIGKLPEKHREVVCLKFQNGLSYREISEIADISVSNVGFILHTALKRLRADWAETSEQGA